MGRTGEKTSKKKVSFEEPPAKKRAKMDAQQKNAAELKELLASKTHSGVKDPEIGPTGHIFVDGAVPVNDTKQSAAGPVQPQSHDDLSDPLAAEAGEPVDVLENHDQDRDSEADAVERDASERDASEREDSEQEDDGQENTLVDFPMPVKLNPEEGEQKAMLEAGPSVQKKAGKAAGTPKQTPEDQKPTMNFLLSAITEQREKIRDLKAKNKVLEEEKKNLQNLSLRLTQENIALKDGRNIPRAKFTAVPGINITVEQLDQMAKQTTKTSIFVGLLILKLVGETRLVGMSVTGKPCQRFRNKRNADGTATHPAKEGLDPKIFKFICDKVAERAAIIHGAENVVLIRAEAKEATIRSVIATKIQNLKKALLNRSRELENSGSELEKEEETTPE